MKKIITLILLISSLTTLTAQNIFFVGGKSYPCTKSFELESDNNRSSDNLTILIAKNGNSGFIAVSKRTDATAIKGKMTIYLNDGTWINCTDRHIYDYVNNISTTVYYLTSSEINRLKTANILTIRYSLKRRKNYGFFTEEGDYSASNPMVKKYKYKKVSNEKYPLFVNRELIGEEPAVNVPLIVSKLYK